MKLMLTEATVRGRIMGTTVATKFTAHNTPDDAAYQHNMPSATDYISTYVASDKVKLTGTSEKQIEQISTQKFLSTYL